MNASADLEEKSEKVTTLTKGTDTLPTERQTQPNKTPARYVATPIRVSEQQYQTVKEETLQSFSLLNSSAEELLSAMRSMVPPENSPRQLGEGTAQSMRQLAKSVCDIINTKCNVIRQVHSIMRDE